LIDIFYYDSLENTNLYILNRVGKNMEKDIDRISKNPDTDIVIRIDDFGGKVGLTIREFVKSERYTGFTKAGTRIPAEYFKQFKEAINSIDEKDFVAGEQATLNGQDSSGQEESDKKEGGDSDSEEIEEQAM